MNLRGNVETRLAKRESGVVEATILALAGLNRLGMGHVGTPIPRTRCYQPSARAPSASRLAPTTRAHMRWLAAIDHAATATCVSAEHAMLAVLDGSCRTPIAGHAILAGGRASPARPDRPPRRLGSDLYGAPWCSGRCAGDGPRCRRRTETPRRARLLYRGLTATTLSGRRRRSPETGSTSHAPVAPSSRDQTSCGRGGSATRRAPTGPHSHRRAARRRR